MDKNYSYIYGILLSDGHLSVGDRNRGRVCLEISYKDKDICDKLYNIVPKSSITYRTKKVTIKNHSYNTELINFRNCQKSFRDYLIDNGFPIGKKSEIADIPNKEYSEIDFWRGFIDGDGSLGYTKDNKPFLSLITMSENIKIHYIDFIYRMLGIIKNNNRNKRDNVYNISLFNENAIKLTNILYYDNCLALDRKYNIAKSFDSWVRTKPKKWDKITDEYILNHSIEDCMLKLCRTEESIKKRIERLKK